MVRSFVAFSCFNLLGHTADGDVLWFVVVEAIARPVGTRKKIPSSFGPDAQGLQDSFPVRTTDQIVPTYKYTGSTPRACSYH